MQFTGQARDGEAGMDYFGARFYQPRHGRFSTVDPVYAGLFDPQQWNRYTYVRNSPLVLVDPEGHDTIPTFRVTIVGSLGNTHKIHTRANPSDDWVLWVLSAQSGSPNVDDMFPGPDRGQRGRTGQGRKPNVDPEPDLDPDPDPDPKDPKDPDPCSAVPTGPRPNELKNNVMQGAIARSMYSEPYLRDWFYNKVKNDGPWNYKRDNPSLEKFGNVNYAAAGRALGFWEITLRAASIAYHVYNKGIAAVSPGNVALEYEDQQAITLGVEYYENRCHVK